MIKDRIKELREKNGLTITAFAKSVGISQTSASLYESGRQNPGKKTIEKICEVYGVDEAWLMETPVDIASSKHAEDAAIESVTDTEEKPAKPEKNAEKKKTKEIDIPSVLARVAEIGVRKAADEAGVAWQTVNKWKRDAEKAFADIKEVMPAPTPDDIEEVMADIKDAVGDLTTPADLKAGLEAIATVVEMTEEPTVNEKKPEKKKPANIIIQSPMGGAITPEQILEKVPAGADSVYVRVDENKLYWVKGTESGAVDIW